MKKYISLEHVARKKLIEGIEATRLPKERPVGADIHNDLEQLNPVKLDPQVGKDVGSDLDKLKPIPVKTEPVKVNAPVATPNKFEPNKGSDTVKTGATTKPELAKPTPAKVTPSSIKTTFTAYSPQKGGDKMEGGYAAARAGFGGEPAIVRTLHDYATGKSKYMTVAADPKITHSKNDEDRKYTIPSITYHHPETGEPVTVNNVKAYAHDTGSAFKGAGESHFDIPVHRDMHSKHLNSQPFSMRSNGIVKGWQNEEVELEENFHLTASEKRSTKTLFTAKAKHHKEINKLLDQLHDHAKKHDKEYVATVHNTHTGEVRSYKMNPHHSQHLGEDFKKEVHDVLDKKVYKPEALAKKHGVSLEHINSQLTKGIKDESEHTSHEDVARQIALAHIEEDPNYYTKLSKVEEMDGTYFRKRKNIDDRTGETYGVDDDVVKDFVRSTPPSEPLPAPGPLSKDAGINDVAIKPTPIQRIDQTFGELGKKYGVNRAKKGNKLTESDELKLTPEQEKHRKKKLRQLFRIDEEKKKAKKKEQPKEEPTKVMINPDLNRADVSEAAILPTSVAGKVATKLGIKSTPGLGSLASLGFAAKNAYDGDYKGAVLNTISAVPGPIGWAGVAASTAHEIHKSMTDDTPSKPESTASAPKPEAPKTSEPDTSPVPQKKVKTTKFSSFDNQ